MINFAEIAAHLAMDYRATRDQIDAMERNKKFPVETVTSRRNSLPLKAAAVHILRVVAADEEIANRVRKKLEARGP